LYKLQALGEFDLIKVISSLGAAISVIQSQDTTEFEGEPRDTTMILLFEDSATREKAHVKISFSVSSYSGLEYLSYKIVKPVTKIVEVFK
jgi:hypothetical protein